MSGFITYLVGLALLFGLYLWALRLLIPSRGEASRAEIGLRFVLITGAALAAALWLSYPLGAIDVFVYAIYTRGWALHGLNPLATAPAQYPATDPWLGLAAEWIDAPSPYGPVWQVLSLGAYYAGGGEFYLEVYAFSTLLLLLIWVARRDLSDFAKKPRGVGALRHDRVCVESAGADRGGAECAQRHRHDLLPAGGRVDPTARARTDQPALLIRPLILAVGRPRGCKTECSSLALSSAGLSVLALSMLTKFITIVIVPFFLLALMSRGQRWPDRIARLIGFGLLIGALIVIGTLPLWPGWDQWAVVQGADSAGRSILALLVLTFEMD